MGKGELGLRLAGVAGGATLLLPTAVLAATLLSFAPSDKLSILFGGFAVGLLLATIAVVDGQAWGAAVIALYGVGMGIRYAMALAATPYATTQDAVFVALHVSIGVLSGMVCLGLIGAHGAHDAG